MNKEIFEAIDKARIIGIETAIELVRHAIKWDKDPVKELEDHLKELKDRKRMNENQPHGSDLWPEVKK